MTADMTITGRKALIVRLSASTEERMMSEAIDYLIALGIGPAQKVIEDILVMNLLPLAAQSSGKYDKSELKEICQQTSEEIEAYVSQLKQKFKIEPSSDSISVRRRWG